MHGIHLELGAFAVALMLVACSGPDHVSLGQGDGAGGVDVTGYGGSAAQLGGGEAGGNPVQAGGSPTYVGGESETHAAEARCTSDEDCQGGLRCGYSIHDGCAAQGICVESNCEGGGVCITPAGMCGCDGQPVVGVRFENGPVLTISYASAPSTGRIGPCLSVPDSADAQAQGAGGSSQGADGGNATSVAGSQRCAKDEDCGREGVRCGYPTADLCAAQGVCIVGNCEGGSCVTPGGMCGCDGQPVVGISMRRDGSDSLTITYTSGPYSGRIGPCRTP